MAVAVMLAEICRYEGRDAGHVGAADSTCPGDRAKEVIERHAHAFSRSGPDRRADQRGDRPGYAEVLGCQSQPTNPAQRVYRLENICLNLHVEDGHLAPTYSQTDRWR